MDDERVNFRDIVFRSSLSDQATNHSTEHRSSLSNRGINDCVDDQDEEELLGLFRSGSFTDIAHQTLHHKLCITMRTENTIIHKISPVLSKPFIKVKLFIAVLSPRSLTHV